VLTVGVRVCILLAAFPSPPTPVINKRSGATAADPYIIILDATGVALGLILLALKLIYRQRQQPADGSSSKSSSGHASADSHSGSRTQLLSAAAATPSRAPTPAADEESGEGAGGVLGGGVGRPAADLDAGIVQVEVVRMGRP